MVKGLAAGSTNLLLAWWLGATWPGTSTLASAAALGFLSYGASLVLFVVALCRLGTARTGAYFSVAPFFGALLGVFMLGEQITPVLLLAGAQMAVGVWLQLTERHGHLHTHDPDEHPHEHVHDEDHQHCTRAAPKALGITVMPMCMAPPRTAMPTTRTHTTGTATEVGPKELAGESGGGPRLTARVSWPTLFGKPDGRRDYTGATTKMLSFILQVMTLAPTIAGVRVDAFCVGGVSCTGRANSESPGS